VTKTGKILEVNKKIEDILGYKPDELIGKNFMTLGILAAKNAARMLHIFKEAVKIGGFLVSRDGRNVTEVWVNHKDGHTVLLEANTTTIKENGKLVGYLSIIRDITERKAAEDKLLEYQEKLKKMSAKLLSTEERERHRIAVGFHDNIAQELVIVKMSIESSLKLVSDPNALGSLRIATEAIGDMIYRTELLIYELNNPILHELGLAEAIKSYCTKEVRQKHGIAFELEADERLKIPNEEVKNCLFRVTRELLTNVIKHAHAHKVKVSVQKSRNQIHISVQDDGKGFKESEAGARKSRTIRFGLFSIREQLEYLGGHLEIESEPGQGTKATVVIPLRGKATV
jgi:PAS domain S-box-containing protein